jgi:hypothetical protein
MVPCRTISRSRKSLGSAVIGADRGLDELRRLIGEAVKTDAPSLTDASSPETISTWASTAGMVGAAGGVGRLAVIGADLIFATFSHSPWIAQSRQIGFVPVPTTTHLFVSPALGPLLPPLWSFHLTRGDCDGPLPYEGSVEAGTG